MKTNFCLNIALLTLSDSRSLAQDSSGQYLADAITSAGHHLADRKLLRCDFYPLRAQVSQWIADVGIQVVLISGGTGFHPRDCAPEALLPLLAQQVDGFGEQFRQLSFADIGSAAMQSRAFAGLANHTLIACMPGSTNACRTAWQHLLAPQLDASTGPCNFVAHLLGEHGCVGR
ncbi:molybdenum cofactor biosynthesis protein B [Bowmanella denitrificans]|uniref:molybdenum cofactor biosynthesis protein B n=1 Tax=Bowmanella denitrificans TaxID=366582 RepID=UPI000C9C7C6F|nr:molybdenum cofactor biosynthesis protein B [Bowmanella denitrificans]